MAHPVTLVPGDGIGPEVVAAARRVLDASGARLEWEVHQMGQPAVDDGADDPVPASLLESIRRNRVALKGPVTTGLAGFRSPNIALRKALDLYAQVRPVRSIPGPASQGAGVDLVVIRETTEDLYAGIEYRAGTADAKELTSWIARHGFDVAADAGVSVKPTSVGAVRRTVAFAFDWSRRHGRRRITVVHKATVMRATDGLFLDVAREVAREHTDIELDDRLVDNMAAQMARDPGDCDVLLTSNLYGDILADLAAALVGGVGLAPGANHGADCAVFEAAHGSAPRHAGSDRVNPVAMILSGALLLRHVGEVGAAERVERAVADVVADGRFVTYDLKADRDDPTVVGTRAMADAVVGALR